MAKTRIEKAVTPSKALEVVRSKGMALGLSLWTLHKLCRSEKIKHERSGPGSRAKILIKPSVLMQFARTLIH